MRVPSAAPWRDPGAPVPAGGPGCEARSWRPWPDPARAAPTSCGRSPAPTPPRGGLGGSPGPARSRRGETEAGAAGPARLKVTGRGAPRPALGVSGSSARAAALLVSPHLRGMMRSFLCFSFFSYFFVFWVWATPGGAPGFLPAVCSETAPGRPGGPCGTRDSNRPPWALDPRLQGPRRCALSPGPSIPFFRSARLLGLCFGAS